MKHIVVFASGSGTNFQALIDAVESNKIDARLLGLISSNPEAGALRRAERNGIPASVMHPSDYKDDRTYTEALKEQLEEWDTDLIVLAGYLFKIPAAIIKHYRDRIINIHPSLLPKYGGKGYYGEKVHRSVLENNEKVSGCTVHIVTEEYDKGPILAQEKVRVYPSDDVQSLAQRVLEKEHRLLPEVTANMIEELKSKEN